MFPQTNRTHINVCISICLNDLIYTKKLYWNFDNNMLPTSLFSVETNWIDTREIPNNFISNSHLFPKKQNMHNYRQFNANYVLSTFIDGNSA